MQTTVRRIIEMAAESVGSDVRLAERIGVSRQRLYEWKDGRRPIPMARLEHVAIIAGINPENAIAVVAVERHRLGKRIAVLALTALAGGVLSPQAPDGAPLDKLHIMRSVARALQRFASSLRRADRRKAAPTCSPAALATC